MAITAKLNVNIQSNFVTFVTPTTKTKQQNQNTQQTHNITSYGGWHGTSPHYQRYIMLVKVWLGVVLNTVRPTPVGFISFLNCPQTVPRRKKPQNLDSSIA